jgi:hypothetical protein
MYLIAKDLALSLRPLTRVPSHAKKDELQLVLCT